MTALAFKPVNAVGVQTPTYTWVPDGAADRSLLDLAVEFNTLCGLPDLAPWQRLVLGDWLATAGRQWLATEWTLLMPRQNGKTHLAILRMLFGLLVLRERKIVFTTHNFGVTRALMDDMRRIIAASEHLSKALTVSLSNGFERITTKDGRGVIRFKARSKHGPRGLSQVDLLIYDEAFLLDPETQEAFGYTQSASVNPQTLYLSSAGDPESHVLLDRRRRGHEGGSTIAGYHEWCAYDGDDPADSEVWLRGNPGVGYALRFERLVQEWETGRRNPRSFSRERLGIWPAFSTLGKAVDIDQFGKCLDEGIGKPPADTTVAFAVDVEYDRSAASLACAWHQDGTDRVVIVQHAPTQSAVLGRLPHSVGAVTDINGQLWSVRLRPSRDVREAFDTVQTNPDLPTTYRPDAVRQLTWAEYASACQGFATAVKERAVRIGPSGALVAAVTDAVPKIDRDGGWVFDRNSESAPNSALVAASIALWSLRERRSAGVMEVPQIW